MKRIIANTGEKRKKRLQPQRQSAETQPLLLVLALRARAPNSSEPLPPTALAPICWISLPFSPWGRSCAGDTPREGLGAGSELGRAEPGYSACPPTCPHDCPSTSTSTGICQRSPPTRTPKRHSRKYCLQEIGIYGNRVSKRHSTNFSGTQTQFPKGR